MKMFNFLKRIVFVFSFLAIGVLTNPSSLKAQDIVAILSCPMGCGVMEGNTIFGTMMAKANEDLIVALSRIILNECHHAFDWSILHPCPC